MKPGALLKSELKKRGLMLTFVAEKTGIPYNTLKQYLNDYREIPHPKLELICLKFGIDQKIFGLDDTYKFHKEVI